MRRRRVIIVAIALLLLCAGVPLWSALELPPPGLLLEYGLPPAGGPTGREQTVMGMEFVEIGPGYFRMGSHHGCESGDLLGRAGDLLGIDIGRSPEHGGDECPPRWVEIERPFWIARTEVTNAVYQRFRPDHERPEGAAIDRHPATNLSWRDSRDFCRWLSEETGLSCRLPSEAEWEYACRAGSAGEFCFGDDQGDLGCYAWYGENSDDFAHEVAGLRPNAWGLFDMHGNVWEWVEDHWHDNYRDAPPDGRAWASVETGYRVVRGGAFSEPTRACRSGRGVGWVMFVRFRTVSGSGAFSESESGVKCPMLGMGDEATTNWNLGSEVNPNLRDPTVGFRPVFTR